MNTKTMLIIAIVLTGLMAFSAKAVCQTKSTFVSTKNDYLKKSSKQRTAGWMLGGAGAGMFIAGFAIDRGDLVQDGYLYDEYKNDKVKDVLKVTGFSSIVGGAILLIVANRNLKKANRVSFKFNSQPAFSVTINIR